MASMQLLDSLHQANRRRLDQSTAVSSNSVLTWLARCAELGLAEDRWRRALRETYGYDLTQHDLAEFHQLLDAEHDAWRSRKLASHYPFVWFDTRPFCLAGKHGSQAVTVLTILALDLSGHKEVLDLCIWPAENEAPWKSIAQKLRERGVDDLLLALTDHPHELRLAFSNHFPQCSVHANLAQQLIHSQDRVISRDRRRIGQHLHSIAHAETVADAHQAVLKLADAWRCSYPQIAHCWERQWPELAESYTYPAEIRRILCTAHSQRVLNRQFARVAGRNQQFASRLHLQRTGYLAIVNSMRKWTMPVQRWNLALAQLLTQFPNRVDHLVAM